MKRLAIGAALVFSVWAGAQILSGGQAPVTGANIAPTSVVTSFADAGTVGTASIVNPAAAGINFNPGAGQACTSSTRQWGASIAVDNWLGGLSVPSGKGVYFDGTGATRLCYYDGTILRCEGDGFGFDPSTQSISDNGGGSAAAGTATFTSSEHQVTCNDANGCDLTLSETGAGNGGWWCIVNVSANTVNFADTSGVSETAGAFAAGQWDRICFGYVVDRWVETSRSNN